MYSRCFFLTQTGRSFGKKPFCSFVQFSGACFRVFLLLGMVSFKSKCKAVFSGRCCFGCFAKPTTVSADETTSKGLRVQEILVKKSSILNDIWTTSAGEMENSNQPLDPCSNAGGTGNPPEFVNRGLLFWNQTRQQWLGNKKTQNRMQVREPVISWNATYESLLGNNKPFSRPIPLAEMMGFLVDVWDQEGLYD